MSLKINSRSNADGLIVLSLFRYFQTAHKHMFESQKQTHSIQYNLKLQVLAVENAGLVLGFLLHSSPTKAPGCMKDLD